MALQCVSPVRLIGSDASGATLGSGAGALAAAGATALLGPADAAGFAAAAAAALPAPALGLGGAAVGTAYLGAAGRLLAVLAALLGLLAAAFFGLATWRGQTACITHGSNLSLTDRHAHAKFAYRTACTTSAQDSKL